MRFFNPFVIRRYFADLNSIRAGGGPTSVHVVRVGEPAGLIVPSSEVIVEVTAKDGTKVCLDPEIPMPFLLGWGIRLARRLGVPVISDLEPESFSFGLGRA